MKVSLLFFCGVLFSALAGAEWILPGPQPDCNAKSEMGTGYQINTATGLASTYAWFVNTTAGQLLLVNGQPNEATFSGQWWIQNEPGFFYLMPANDNGLSQWGEVNLTCANAIPLPNIYNMELHGYTTAFVEYMGRFKLIMDWKAGPAYNGLVIDYFEGPMLDMAGNYFGTQWFNSEGLYMALDNIMPQGGLARSLITKVNNSELPSELFASSKSKFCGTSGKTSTFNATLYDQIAFPAPKFIAPSDYFKNQVATGFYSCNRCNGENGTAIKRRAALHVDADRHQLRLDIGNLTYVATDEGSYMIDTVAGNCSKAAPGFNYINVTTGLIGINKDLGTPRPMEYQATFQVIDHEFAKEGDKFEVFMGPVQWVDLERRFGSRWYNKKGQLAALTVINKGHYVSSGKQANTINVPVSGTSYPPPGIAAMIGEETVSYDYSATGFQQIFFTKIKSKQPNPNVFAVVSEYCY